MTWEISLYTSLVDQSGQIHVSSLALSRIKPQTKIGMECFHYIHHATFAKLTRVFRSQTLPKTQWSCLKPTQEDTRTENWYGIPCLDF
jgi:hypothetical protein